MTTTTTPERPATVPAAPGVDLADLYRRHWAQLNAAAARITGNPHDAADAVQDAFVRAWRFRHRITGRPDTPPYVLLWVITRRAAHRHLADAARHGVPAGDWANEFPDPGPGAAAQVPESQWMYRLNEALPLLKPPRRRLALHLRYWECMSFAEVGTRMGITEHAAKTLEVHAVTRLRQLMVDPQAAAGRSARPDPAVTAALADPHGLDGLPPRQRDVVRLVHREGLTYAQAGERLGISAGTVHGHIRAAHAALRGRTPGPAVRSDPLVDAVRRDPARLDVLTARQREAWRLHYLDGLTVTQTAARMGVKPRAVADYCAKARVRLLAAIDDTTRRTS